MSGHNKWSKIKRAKGSEDAKRSKVFSRFSKEITIAVKEGGEDPEGNPRLRTAIQNAKGASMPKEVIERAIKKSNKDTSQFVELNYEGYAPNGIAVFLECATDNQHRTIANVRAIFNKNDGSLSKNGSLSFVFDRKGVFNIKKEAINDIDTFELEVIDAGAEDFEIDDDLVTVTTSMEDFGTMQKKLEEIEIVPENSGLERIPNNTEELPVEKALRVLKIIDLFEEDDDVQKVYHNLELTDELVIEYEKE
ncbi:MAG: YebC/PmpR family DNA-binding transcriptional regulator [Bacteroidota bacterium]|nr:YebC/PmpR family DNA-binding transcriptional regulator [Bacteroidota bacterium]